VSFFFESVSEVAGQVPEQKDALSPTHATDFLATADGQALVKAFMRISDKAIRRSIVRLVEAVTENQRL